MESLLLKYGYALLFLGVSFEGEAVLLAAALLAQRGFFRLPVVIAVAVAANSLADQVYFQLARLRGRAWLERRFGQHPRYQRLLELVGRRGGAPARREPLRLRPSHRHPRRLRGSRHGGGGLHAARPAGRPPLGPAHGRPRLLRRRRSRSAPRGREALRGGGRPRPRRGRRRVPGAPARAAHGAVARAAMGRPPRRRAVRRRPDGRPQPALGHLAPRAGGDARARAVAPARGDAAQPRRSCSSPGWRSSRSRATSAAARRSPGGWPWSPSRSRSSPTWGARSTCTTRSSPRSSSAYLVVFRRRFTARSDPASLRQALVMAPVLAATVWVFGVVGLADLRDQFAWDAGNTPAAEAVRSGLLILDPGVDPVTAHAARFLGALQIAGWAARLYLLVLVLRPVILRRRQEAPPEEVEPGGARARPALALRLRRAGGQAPPGRRRRAGARGLRRARARGLRRRRPAVRGGRPRGLRPRAGWSTAGTTAGRRASTRRPRSACRSTGGWACDPSRWPRRRSSTSARSASPAASARPCARWSTRSTRMGLVVRRYDRAAAPEPADRRAARGDLRGVAGREAAGRDGLQHRPLLARVARRGLRVPLPRRGAGRRVHLLAPLPRGPGRPPRPHAQADRTPPPGRWTCSCRARSRSCGRAGLEEASLANAPLANVGEPRGGLEKGVALLFENLNSFYGYKNLFQFKKKFAPRWEGRYLVYPRGAELPRVAYALTGVHGAGGLRRLVLGR